MKSSIILVPSLAVFMALSGFSCMSVMPTGITQQTTTPSTQEITGGLKQALLQGTGKSTNQLSAVNGFFGNAAIKILFPPQAQKAEKTLRSIGMGKLCDDVILSLNRAAEDASKKAQPIFMDAISHMTLQDVTNILLGPPDAATQYFKRTTSVSLTAAFKPIIQQSLNSVGATKYYGEVANDYNKIPFVSKINPDISDYTTQKALDGLFLEIAQEELNIRKNIGVRSTPLLQKVFGYADGKQSQ